MSMLNSAKEPTDIIKELREIREQKVAEKNAIAGKIKEWRTQEIKLTNEIDHLRKLSAETKQRR